MAAICASRGGTASAGGRTLVEAGESAGPVGDAGRKPPGRWSAYTGTGFITTLLPFLSVAAAAGGALCSAAAKKLAEKLPEEPPPLDRLARAKAPTSSVRSKLDESEGGLKRNGGMVFALSNLSFDDDDDGWRDSAVEPSPTLAADCWSEVMTILVASWEGLLGLASLTLPRLGAFVAGTSFSAFVGSSRYLRLLLLPLSKCEVRVGAVGDAAKCWGNPIVALEDWKREKVARYVLARRYAGWKSLDEIVQTEALLCAC